MEFSASSDSSGEQHKYSQLDEFAQSSELAKEESETGSEIPSETTSENPPQMTDEDAQTIAGMGVEQISNYISESIDAPIVIGEKHKEEIAVKGAALVKKYLPNGEMPPWLLAWKIEIEFGLAVGACGFSVYKQIKEHENAVLAEKRSKEFVDEVTHGG